MENPPFEDVFPIGKGGFSMAMLVYWRVQLTTTPSSTEARNDLDLLPWPTKNHRLVVQRKLLAKGMVIEQQGPSPNPPIYLHGKFLQKTILERL